MIHELGTNDKIVAKFDFCEYPVTLTYADIATLMQKKRRRKSRRSLTNGSKLSRHIGLVNSTIRTGVWVTGGKTDILKIMNNLQRIIDALPANELLELTPKGRDSFKNIIDFDSYPEEFDLNRFKDSMAERGVIYA